MYHARNPKTEIVQGAGLLIEMVNNQLDSAVPMDEHLQLSPPISHSGEGEEGEDPEEGDSVNPREGSGGSKGKTFARAQDSGVFEMAAGLPRAVVQVSGAALAPAMASSPLSKLRLNPSSASCPC